MNPKGKLGMTAKDHATIGSTPDPELAANPDKTKAELMSDAEIVKYLDTTVAFIKDMETKDSGFARDAAREFRDTHAGDLAYLNRIGRLPEKYQTQQ